ncbi:isochorismate synthase [Sporosarcina sp. P13]|uniref:isochorismate synthase n=1 Tax=Sporosarcina sp. P13 TaxID=2048263 RepID=UPI000C1629EC|nr:isochorismate synthase [Sporosarcina sp. P13]PIC64261.1 isochorismate synthase [Sporosarcina sp. P13]
MNWKLTDRANMVSATGNNARFFTETIEVETLSPLAFFEAGHSHYGEDRFFWQNADKTVKLVGLGQATVLTADDNRFESISLQWKALCDGLIKEEKDMNPVLFGGFSFDPQTRQDDEWNSFPAAYFSVPLFQMKIEKGKTYVSINYLTEEPQAASDFEALRHERDRLIHIAQVEEFTLTAKPDVVKQTELETDRYMKTVKRVTSQIKEQVAEKVVIARKIKLTFEKEFQKAAALHAITNEQSASYHFGLQIGQEMFFGATPERLVEISNGQAYSACVAGSIERGKTAQEDQQLGEILLRDKKNREEHQYVVDMITKVFSEFCTSLQVNKTPKLLKVRDIQHLFTPVEGKLAENMDIFRLVEALHPTPALGGVPRTKALEMIREEEQMDRGFYAGPIGWTDAAGNGEFAVAIRSGLLIGKDAYLYAGGGIVADSTPTEEYAETWVKFRPVLRALGGRLHD